MNAPKKTQEELAAIRVTLSRAIASADPEEWQEIVRKTIRRIDKIVERLDSAPAELGSKGGKKTAERGSEWFRQLSAMRTTRAGGRPKKH